MKPSQLAVSVGKTAAAAMRAGALVLIALVALLPSAHVSAAIDRGEPVSRPHTALGESDFARSGTVETIRYPTLQMADAMAPPARSDASNPPNTAKPHKADTPPSGLSPLDRIQDWLARANREYQTTVIPRLSVPTPESIAAEKRKVEEAQQAEDARKAAEQARLAEEARKAEEAKQAEEARKAAEQARLAEEARKAAEQARLAEEARKAEEAKQAEDARQAAEQARLAEEARKAEEAKQAEAARQAAEQARLTEEARKAEEAKQAEEARKAAEQARLAEEARKAEEAKQAEEARQAAEQARLAEEARKAEEAKQAEAARQAAEQQRLAEEARKAEEAKQAADAQRKADEAKSLAEAQAKAEEAKKAEANREHAAAVDAEPDGEPSAEPMPPEAIPSPGTDAAQKLPPSTSGEESDSDLQEETAQAPVKSQQNHANHVRRAATKRWISRMHRDRCPSSGRRITPPGYYRVQSGDSLWRISRRHYRAGARYRRIYRANRSRIRDPDLIYPCQMIYVPRRH